jgi:hypothetical protein
MGNIHLYTIWNPALSDQTIEEHIRTLINEAFVKWLILYDDEIAFKDTLNSKNINRLNKQAENRETLLFIQCLNIFYKSLYVGRVEKIEKIHAKNIVRNDQLIPDYYKTERLSDKKLQAYYSIILSDIRKIDLNEIPNLVPSESFKSAKFNFPFPCLVAQKKPRLFFKKPGIDKFDKIEIVYEYDEDLKKTRWFVKKPKSVLQKKPLTLGKRELQLLRIFEDRHPSGLRLTTILKELKITNERGYNLISTINRKFHKKHYRKPLIVNVEGIYRLKTAAINIRGTNNIT